MRNSEVFRNLDDAALDWLSEVAVRRGYQRGLLVFSQGDCGNSLYGVITGMVQVFDCTMDGHEVIIDTRGPNHCFGDLSLLDGQPRCASARAATDSELFVICGNHVLELLANNRSFSMDMLVLLARRLRWAAELVRREYACRHGSARLAHRLLQQVHDHGVSSGPGQVLLTSQGDLAKQACLSRQVVNHYLRAWQDRGLISITRGQLIIREPLTLATIAEGRVSLDRADAVLGEGISNTP